MLPIAREYSLEKIKKKKYRSAAEMKVLTRMSNINSHTLSYLLMFSSLHLGRKKEKGEKKNSTR